MNMGGNNRIIDPVLTAYQPSLADIPKSKEGENLTRSCDIKIRIPSLSVFRNSSMVLAAPNTGRRLSVEETGFGACGIPDPDPGGAAKGCDDGPSVT